MLINDGDIGGRYKSDYCLCQAWASPLTEGLANTGWEKIFTFFWQPTNGGKKYPLHALFSTKKKRKSGEPCQLLSWKFS